MRLELLPIPEHYESFLITTKKENLEKIIETLSQLRNQNILTSLVHIVDPMRFFISTHLCPQEYKNKLMSREDAIKNLQKSLLFNVGYWNAFGGIYGTKEEVQVRKKVIKQSLPFANLMFFSDVKLKVWQKIIDSRLISLVPSHFKRQLNQTIKIGSYLHGLAKGKPSKLTFKSIQWRCDDYEDIGLIWYVPTFSAEGKKARTIFELAKSLFDEYGFELSISLNFVTPDRLVGIICIHYNKNMPEQREKAFNLYRDLEKKCLNIGIVSYRKPIIDMKIEYDEGKLKVLKQIKDKLDPNRVISIGRYGI